MAASPLPTSAPAPAPVRDELHPTFEDPVQGTLYRLHCTAAGCGTYVDDTPVKPPVDFLCDDCLEQADPA